MSRANITVTAELSIAELDRIAQLLKQLNLATNPQHCSHGALDLPQLVSMLLQDVALVVSRPGSWEGSGMAQLLASHGYR